MSIRTGPWVGRPTTCVAQSYHANYTGVTTGIHPTAEPGPALSYVNRQHPRGPGTVLRTKSRTWQGVGG